MRTGDDLRRRASTLFHGQVSGYGSTGDPLPEGEEIIHDVASGPGEAITFSRREKIGGSRFAKILLRVWRVGPGGERRRTLCIQFPASALPLFAEGVAKVLDEELAQLPAWAQARVATRAAESHPATPAGGTEKPQGQETP